MRCGESPGHGNDQPRGRFMTLRESPILLEVLIKDGREGEIVTIAEGLLPRHRKRATFQKPAALGKITDGGGFFKQRLQVRLRYGTAHTSPPRNPRRPTNRPRCTGQRRWGDRAVLCPPPSRGEAARLQRPIRWISAVIGAYSVTKTSASMSRLISQTCVVMASTARAPPPR